MDYNKIIKDLRELARDFLRLEILANANEQRYLIELDKKQAEKDLAVKKYNADKLDQDHPNYEELRKQADKNIESSEKLLKLVNETLTITDKKISDIVSGEVKVNKESLAVKVKELLNSYISEKVKELE